MTKRWLTVDLHIPTCYQDAMISFLIDEGASGIEEVSQDLGWSTLRAYLSQNGQEKKFMLALWRYLRSLRHLDPEAFAFRVDVSSIPEQDWGKNWRKFFRPLHVTPKIIVKPPWSFYRTKRNQIVVEITPGMAFGTGTHATTRLCLRALERCLNKKGLSVLDVGTGSGILSIAAAKLGAEAVWGIDVDDIAIEIAKENVKRNGVAGLVRMHKGSIGNIRRRFDVVVANLDLRGLTRMRWPLFRHLNENGFLILSGMLKEDINRLCDWYLSTGCSQQMKVTEADEWGCIILRAMSRLPA